MRIILILFTMIVLPLISNCQSVVKISSANGVARFQKIINIDSASKSDLYRATKKWIITRFKSVDKVIKDSIENKEIKGQVFEPDAIELSAFPPVYISLRYSFTIEMEDGKERFTMDNMVCVFPNVTYTIENYVMKHDGTFRTDKTATKMINGVSQAANRIIISLENSLLNKKEKNDNDW